MIARFLGFNGFSGRELQGEAMSARRQTATARVIQNPAERIHVA
jgi:hypothetical protein